jgi:molybdopterin converting factor subunit 1
VTQVQLLYFGRLADTVGTRETSVDLPATVRDTCSLLNWLESEGIDQLRTPTVRIVVNSTIINGTAPIEPGDEIAFLPPTSGG